MGTRIVNTARVGLEDQSIHFHRAAVVRVGTPDLSPSAFQCSPASALPGAIATCTLSIANAGPVAAPTALVTNSLPADGVLIPNSLAWVGGGAAEALTQTVFWAGSLSGGSQVTLTYQIVLPADPSRTSLYNVAFLEDGTGGTWERTTWVLVEPLRWYLPLAFRNGPPAASTGVPIGRRPDD
jgi:uncharacterized repeat protein (TIGR01451 family)